MFHNHPTPPAPQQVATTRNLELVAFDERLESLGNCGRILVGLGLRRAAEFLVPFGKGLFGNFLSAFNFRSSPFVSFRSSIDLRVRGIDVPSNWRYRHDFNFLILLRFRNLFQTRKTSV